MRICDRKWEEEVRDRHVAKGDEWETNPLLSASISSIVECTDNELCPACDVNGVLFEYTTQWIFTIVLIHFS